jgi:hypothetical protein
MARRPSKPVVTKVTTAETSASVNNYRAEFVHNVKGTNVASEVAKRRGYRTYNILPEPDGEFTLIFIYDA